MRRVLMLGAGLVSGPIAGYILKLPDTRLTVASLEHPDAQALVGGHPNGRAREVNVANLAELSPLIRDSDLVISLVPFTHHPPIARLAVEHGVHVITTSYVSPEMRALDGAARRAGVLLLNEIGLDPGIDHMSAMRVIDGVRAEGGRVTGFRSCCGGLPAPEAADNPWRYKFSWSPRGALLAGTNPARYLIGGEIREIPAETLFQRFEAYAIEGLGEFEIYPNRDALRYRELYGLTEASTMFRGTIRYPGWSRAMQAIAELGLLSIEPREWAPRTTHAEFLAAHLPPGAGSVAERLGRRLDLPAHDDVLERMRWVGLLSDEPIGTTSDAPLDVIAHLFARKLVYGPGERDMVVQRHEFDVERADGSGKRIVSLHVSYGEPGGDSATSRTVSLPAAIAARQVLDGRIRATGVQIPIVPEIYDPVLDELERFDIRFREWHSPV